MTPKEEVFQLGIGDWGVIIGILAVMAAAMQWAWAQRVRRAEDDRDHMASELKSAQSEASTLKNELTAAKKIATRWQSSSKQFPIFAREHDVLFDMEYHVLKYMVSESNSQFLSPESIAKGMGQSVETISPWLEKLCRSRPHRFLQKQGENYQCTMDSVQIFPELRQFPR